MRSKNQATDQTKDIEFELWRLLDHTRFMIARLREMELAEFGLTPEQAHVLYILDNSGGNTTINKIVDNTRRQHHSISTLVNRMEKQELVRKRKSGYDKRQYEIVITEKGRELFNKLTRDSIKNIFSSLSTKDKADLEMQLKQLLKKAYALHGRK